jgi:hypothetical protein
MGEREIVGSTNVISEEDKQKSNEAAVAFARQTISDKHGMLNQNALMDMTDDELTMRMVEIADRGFVSFRLKVPVDPGWYGEWAPNDANSIAEYQMKGFVIDDKFAPKFGLHSDATGKPIVGDVIHMICPTRIKEAHDRAIQIRFDRTHGRRQGLPEETNYESSIKDLGLSNKFKGQNINTSSQTQVSQREILQTVRGS